jgi:hypothetical protein
VKVHIYKYFIYIIACLSLLLSVTSRADEYVLVMSKDDNVCQHMLGIYNDDLKKYGHIKYELHEEFSSIDWGKIKYFRRVDNGKEYPKYPTVLDDGYAEISKFDIDNDGEDEVVIKKEGSLSGIETQSIFYFESEDAAYFKDNEFNLKDLYTKSAGVIGDSNPEGRVYMLRELPKTVITSGSEYPEMIVYNGLGAHFNFHPFKLQNKYYIDMKDRQLAPQKWLVVLMFMHSSKPTDVCYYLKITS